MNGSILSLPDAEASIGRLQRRLQQDFGVTPIVAAEIEFYLHGSAAHPALEVFWQKLRQACAHAHIAIFKMEKERGDEQHEIALMPQADAVQSAHAVALLKELITHAAQRAHMNADFSAKPYADQPGSGLHIHMHLADSQGQNIFYKKDEIISDALQYAIGGLLAWLPDSMAYFAPYEQSYARFTPGGNAPVTVSWGANNRTVAVRLPDNSSGIKHIEHRVAGADANPYGVIAMLLAAMHDGLSRKLMPGPQIYGDASLPLYELPPLPGNLQEALQRRDTSPLWAGYFS